MNNVDVLNYIRTQTLRLKFCSFPNRIRPRLSKTKEKLFYHADSIKKYAGTHQWQIQNVTSGLHAVVTERSPQLYRRRVPIFF